MAVKVTLNTHIVSKELGCIQADNLSYWDPITKTNLTRGNPTSGDLTGFSSANLVNIANSVKAGVLSVTTGVLNATATDVFSTYSLYASAGSAGAPGWFGITGVAAASPFEKNF